MFRDDPPQTRLNSSETVTESPGLQAESADDPDQQAEIEHSKNVPLEKESGKVEQAHIENIKDVQVEMEDNKIVEQIMAASGNSEKQPEMAQQPDNSQPPIIDVADIEPIMQKRDLSEPLSPSSETLSAHPQQKRAKKSPVTESVMQERATSVHFTPLPVNLSVRPQQNCDEPSPQTSLQRHLAANGLSEVQSERNAPLISRPKDLPSNFKGEQPKSPNARQKCHSDQMTLKIVDGNLSLVGSRSPIKDGKSNRLDQEGTVSRTILSPTSAEIPRSSQNPDVMKSWSGQQGGTSGRAAIINQACRSGSVGDPLKPMKDKSPLLSDLTAPPAAKRQRIADDQAIQVMRTDS